MGIPEILLNMVFGLCIWFSSSKFCGCGLVFILQLWQQLYQSAGRGTNQNILSLRLIFVFSLYSLRAVFFPILCSAYFQRRYFPIVPGEKPMVWSEE